MLDWKLRGSCGRARQGEGDPPDPPKTLQTWSLAQMKVTNRNLKCAVKYDVEIKLRSNLKLIQEA